MSFATWNFYKWKLDLQNGNRLTQQQQTNMAQLNKSNKIIASLISKKTQPKTSNNSGSKRASIKTTRW
jgi:hypothetical protein